MKALVKLYPTNLKGFNFTKKNGVFHDCKIKKDKVIIHDKNNKKVVIKPNDKRFKYEKHTQRSQITSITPLSSYIDYFE